jgi:hypothetical protein
MRREVEDGFAQASVAICVATSTLELGIDIGSIDDVVLIGPPPTLTSFLQRIGRGSRRRGAMQVLCLARSPLEEVRFRALLDLAEQPPGRTMPGAPLDEDAGGSIGPSPALRMLREGRPERLSSRQDVLSRPAHRGPSSAEAARAPAESGLSHPSFRPSVLVQQAFSILKQSPTGGIRLADLRRVAPIEVEDEALWAILKELTNLGYLRAGRLGEWQPDSALDELADAHEIYSNIGADPRSAVVVDAFSGRVIAQVERLRIKGETMLLGGQVLEVVWRDRYRLGVRRRMGDRADGELRFMIVPMAVSLEVSQAVARHLGLAPGQLCGLPHEQGMWLYHFWGDLYGALLGAMLKAHLGFEEDAEAVSRSNEHCLLLPDSLNALPAWDEGLARQLLRRLLPQIEPYLALGRFHSLLPPDLAARAALAQCDLARFESLYREAKLIEPEAGLRLRLLALLEA